jgi:hypothetical protein
MDKFIGVTARMVFRAFVVSMLLFAWNKDAIWAFPLGLIIGLCSEADGIINCAVTVKEMEMRFDYLVSFSFYNTELKRHVFRSVYLKKGEYYLGNMGHPKLGYPEIPTQIEQDRFEEAVRHYGKAIETEFAIISISKLV